MNVQFDYSPRPQFEDYHARDNRWSAIVAHRRAGKTVACVNDLIVRGVYSQKERPRYSYIAPFYSQAKEIAWEYLKSYAGEAVKKVHESSLTVTLFNDARISLFGADNPDALRGVYNDGVILDEYGDCRPSLWGEVILPTLADRRGWATFIGSAKGKNHFYDVIKRSRSTESWFHMTLKASQTGIIPDEELEEIKAQMSDEQYEQEFECNFDAAVLGTYYAKIISMLEHKNQISQDIGYDPDFPVEVACDLGYTDSSAYWFWQYRPDGIAVIDYEEAHSQPLQYYFDMLRSKPYEYETIWLPHDAKAKTLQTGRSTVEQFLHEDLPVKLLPLLKVQHGIDAARLVMPMCYFDKKCDFGIEGLRAYRRNYDENRKSFSDNPVHDWSSHPADGFRYLSLVAKEKIPGLAKPETKSQIILPKQVQYTLDQLFEDRERNRTHGRARV